MLNRREKRVELKIPEGQCSRSVLLEKRFCGQFRRQKDRNMVVKPIQNGHKCCKMADSRVPADHFAAYLAILSRFYDRFPIVSASSTDRKNDFLTTLLSRSLDLDENPDMCVSAGFSQTCIFRNDYC